jgi:hypothetical protein
MPPGPWGDVIERKRRELTKHSSPTPSVMDAESDSPVSFAQVPRSATLDGLCVEEASLSTRFTLPWPGLYHRPNNVRLSMRAVRRTLRRYIASQIE